MAERGRLDGRRALVTGGASGIGYAIAARLCAAGAEVLIADLDGDAAALAARAIGPLARGIGADVRDEDQIAHAVAQAAGDGDLAIAVNNAGYGAFGPLT